jgi:signal transduction histidine kinase
MARDRRLAWLLGVDVATCAVAVVVLLAAHALVVGSPYLVLLAAMVAAAGVVMALGYRPLCAGRASGVVAALAIANYLIAVAATAIAPFAMPILLLATMLPAVLAVPYVSRRQLHGYLGASFLTALGVVALGSLQDVSGLRDDLPRWLASGVVVLFTPFMTTMVSIVALTNATALAEHVAALRASRARVVAAADSERRRIERDLHDGAQQALVTATVQLALLRQDAMRLDPALGPGFDELRDQLHDASAELRDLARGVHPAALAAGGLEPAVRHAVAAFPGEATLQIRTDGRCHPEVERAVYFCLTEALHNTWKHGGEGVHASVTVHGDVSGLRFEVRDDGNGFDHSVPSVGTGLDNMAERLGAVGGQLTVSTSLGQGTTVRGVAPTVAATPAHPTAELQPALPLDTG